MALAYARAANMNTAINGFCLTRICPLDEQDSHQMQNLNQEIKLNQRMMKIVLSYLKTFNPFQPLNLPHPAIGVQ